MKRAVLLLAVLLVMLAGARQARADVVLYSNLGAGGSFNSNSDFVLTPPSGLAFEFTPSTNAQVSDVQVALEFVSATGTSVSVNLYTNSSGVPGSSLGSATVNFQSSYSNPTLITANLTTSTMLLTTSSYWLAIVPGSNAEVLWFVNNTGATASEALSTNSGSSWSANGSITSAAFEVDAPAAVPEPTSFALGGLGVVALLGGYCWRLRKQKAAIAVAPTLS